MKLLTLDGVGLVLVMESYTERACLHCALHIMRENPDGVVLDQLRTWQQPAIIDAREAVQFAAGVIDESSDIDGSTIIYPENVT